jgi:uncharacterized membrane protein YhaH (DUF805 family)
VIGRQKVVGWIMIIVTAGYLAYFWRIKVMTPGPLLTGRDWFGLITAIVCLLIGVANVRLAAMRLHNRRPGPPGSPP